MEARCLVMLVLGWQVNADESQMSGYVITWLAGQ